MSITANSTSSSSRTLWCGPRLDGSEVWDLLPGVWNVFAPCYHTLKSQKPTSRTQPRTHPRGQPGRCAGSSSCASRWTPPILRARNASGPPTKELKSRDKGPLTRPGSPVIAPLNPGQPVELGFPVSGAQGLPAAFQRNGLELSASHTPKSSEGRKSLISTGLCESSGFSTRFREDLTSNKEQVIKNK